MKSDDEFQSVGKRWMGDEREFWCENNKKSLHTFMKPTNDKAL